MLIRKAMLLAFAVTLAGCVAALGVIPEAISVNIKKGDCTWDRPPQKMRARLLHGVCA